MFLLIYLYTQNHFLVLICKSVFVTGGENDDHCSDNIRSLLAALPLVFHHDFDISGHYNVPTHPGNLFGHLLAGNEQFDVQPHYLLLDERQVNQSRNFNSPKLNFYNVWATETNDCPHLHDKINHFHL